MNTVPKCAYALEMVYSRHGSQDFTGKSPAVIRDPKAVRKFEADLARREGRVNLSSAMDQVAALWREGVALGVLPPSDPLEGIETDIRLARILNSCSKTCS